MNEEQDVREDIITELKRSSQVLIATHKNPDGDALGSQIALMLALRKLGKSVCMHNLDPVPEFYRFLPHADEITNGRTVSGSYDALIVMDCEPRRTELFNVEYPARTLINIDHHVTNSKQWSLTWLDPDASATGEMTYHFIKRLGVPLDREMALCLYTAIFTDTGSFRYSNTTPNSMRISAELLELGANSWLVTENVYESYRFTRLKLLGMVLANMERSDDGKVAWVVIQADLFRKTDTNADDTENFINYVRSVKGVEVAVLFRQTAEKQFKISLRSKGRVRVSGIAKNLGGGGHDNAAGAVIDGTLEEVKARVIGEVKKTLQGTLKKS